MRFKDFLFVIGFTALFVDTPAEAYLDSGTISLALQGAAGVAASMILFARTYVGKLKSIFRASKEVGPDDGQS